MKFQIPKGLFDILPYGADKSWKLSSRWHHLENILHQLTLEYGYTEIRTPAFEKEDLFNRSIGEASDIVKKEMYTFKDKADRLLSLRPEGTASVMRAFVESHLDQERNFHKLYYIGPMFRYDRPQAGRYRQHHQFGVEVLGSSGYEVVVEVIDLFYQLTKRLGLKDISLNINSVGDEKARKTYQKELVKFLTPLKLKLSKDSQERLKKNPLRILDSKEKCDQELLNKAPSILDFLTKESQDQLQNTLTLLKRINIDYVVNPKLVRGLDYYNDVVFEFMTKNQGAQNSICGGGRYDTLVESFGGPDIPGVGLAAGLERILQTMEEQAISYPVEMESFVYFAPLDDKYTDECFELITTLRHANIPCDMSFNVKKLPKMIQDGVKKGAKLLIIIGEDEIKSKKITCKNLDTREQQTVSMQELPAFLQKQYKKYQDNPR